MFKLPGHEFSNVIVGVAPNAVITYVSKLYPGSISDKEIVEQSGLMNHMASGDLILADKGSYFRTLSQGVFL